MRITQKGVTAPLPPPIRTEHCLPKGRFVNLKSPAVLVVLMTVVIDAMGIGLIMPVMPALMQELGANDLGRAAIWGTALSALFALMQFTFGPMIGNLSDHFGRRPVLLVSLLVAAIDYILHALAGSLFVLTIARIIAGIAAATQSTANAFMADVSKPEEKAQNFGLIGAAFGIGFILGPLIGGLLGAYGPRAPFIAAAILAALNFTVGYFVLPETVTEKTRRPFEFRRANPFGALQQINKLPGLGRLMVVYFFSNVAFMVYPAVWSYYTLEKFGWTESMVGLSLATFGISIAFAQGFLIRIFIKRFGERKTVFFAYTMNAIAFLLYGFAWQGWMIFALIFLTSLGIMGTPSLQGIMSRRVDDNAQGELQGVLTSVSALASILSPLVMGNLFGYFTSDSAPIYLPGAPFFLCSLLAVISILIFARTKAPSKALT